MTEFILSKTRKGASNVSSKINSHLRALKKKEREKKIKAVYEKIRNVIKEKYKFCNLYVKGLPNDFTQEQLSKLFEMYGKIRSCKIESKEFFDPCCLVMKVVKLFAYVCFLILKVLIRQRWI